MINEMEWVTQWAWSSLAISEPLRNKEGGSWAPLLDLEGFLMPRLCDLVQSFPHPTLVDKEAEVWIFVSVLLYPLINKSPSNTSVATLVKSSGLC